MVLPPGPDPCTGRTEQPDIVDLIASEANGAELHLTGRAFHSQERIESTESVVHPVGIGGIGHFFSIHDQLIGMLAFSQFEVDGPLSLVVEREGMARSRPAIECAHDADVLMAGVVGSEGIGDAPGGAGQNGYVGTTPVEAELQGAESGIRLAGNPDATATDALSGLESASLTPGGNPNRAVRQSFGTEVRERDPSGVRRQAHGHGCARNDLFHIGRRSGGAGAPQGEKTGKEKKEVAHGGGDEKRPTKGRAFQNGDGANSQAYWQMRIPKLLDGGGPANV